MKFVTANFSKTSVLNQVKESILFKTQKQNTVNRIILALSVFFFHISLILFSYFFNTLFYVIQDKHTHFKVIRLRYEVFIHKFCKCLLSSSKGLHPEIYIFFWRIFL